MKELLHTNIKVYVCRRGIRVTYYKLNTLLEHTKGVLKKHILYSSLNDDLTQKRGKKARLFSANCAYAAPNSLFAQFC